MNVAIDAAVDDVNSNPSVLKGSKLVVTKSDTNCDGFLGTIEGIVSIGYLSSIFLLK